MSSRERKRADRQKRKQRSASRPAPRPAGRGEASGSGENVEDIAAAAEVQGISRSELRNESAREKLEPLDEGERPRVVTIGAVVSALIAASIVIGWLTGVKVNVSEFSDEEKRANVFQVFPPAILFGVMAYGMWRARYWAVLGFEAIMAILMVGSFITLVAATSVFKGISAGLVLIGAGALFWFTVKALARIQMPEHSEHIGQ